MPFFPRHKVGVEAITFLHLAEDNVIDRDLFSRRDGFVTAPVAGEHPRFERTPVAPVSNRLARLQHLFQLDVSLFSTPCLGWPIPGKRLVNILLRTNFVRPVNHHRCRPHGLRRDHCERSIIRDGCPHVEHHLGESNIGIGGKGNPFPAWCARHPRSFTFCPPCDATWWYSAGLRQYRRCEIWRLG